MLDNYRSRGMPLVVLDAGDAIESVDPPEKAEVMVRAMAAAGYQALNIGDQEAARGADFLKRIEALTPMPVMSSNLVFADTGQPVVKPFVILDAGGAKIGVLGVLGALPPQTENAPRFAILPPDEAIKRYLPQVRGQSDVVIVLAHVSPEQGKELARIPGVDVVVGGDQRSEIPEPELIGQTLWVQPMSYGRFISVVDLTPEPGGRLRPSRWSAENVPWDSPRKPEVAKITEAYKPQQVAESSGLLGRATALPEGYGGVAKCAECHADIAKSWEKTPHARAWETLKVGAHEYDSECIACHTTGDPSKPPTPALKGVQCEACHLSMSKHAQYDTGARREKDVDWKPICTRCHNDERSPDFDLAVRLPAVKH